MQKRINFKALEDVFNQYVSDWQISQLIDEHPKVKEQYEKTRFKKVDCGNLVSKLR